MFRGREQAHPERGRALLERLFGDLGEIAMVEQAPAAGGPQHAHDPRPARSARPQQREADDGESRPTPRDAGSEALRRRGRACEAAGPTEEPELRRGEPERQRRRGAGARRGRRRPAHPAARGSTRDPGLRRPRREEDLDAVEDVLRSGWLSWGSRSRRSSASSPSTSAASTCVALSSCTAALHLACLAAGVGPGDEVIVPSHDVRRHRERGPLLRRHAGLRRRRRRRDDLSIDVGRVEAAITRADQGRPPGPLRRLPGRRSTASPSSASERGDRPDRGRRPRPRRRRSAGAALGHLRARRLLQLLLRTRSLGVRGGRRACPPTPTRSPSRVRRLRSQGMTATHDAIATAASRRPTTCVELGFNYRFDDPRAALLRSRFAGWRARSSAAASWSRATASCSPASTALAIPYRSRAVELLLLLPDGRARRARRSAARVRARLRDDHGVQTTDLPGRPRAHRLPRVYGETSLPRTERVAARLFSIPLFPHMTDDQQERVVAACSSPSTLERPHDVAVPLTEIELPESDVEAVLDDAASGWLTMGPRTQDAGGGVRRAGRRRSMPSRSRAAPPRCTWPAGCGRRSRATR